MSRTTAQTPRLRIVILNHNAGPLLHRCVESAVRASWSGTKHIVVIDNASVDGSAAALQESFDDIDLVQRSTNSGFGANNEGLANLADVDAVLLLNPDAMVAHDTLELLYAALADAPDIGAACPRIVFDQRFAEFPIALDGGLARIMRVLAGGRDVTGQCHAVGGAYRMPRADGASWWYLDDSAVLRVPVDLGPLTITLGAASLTTIQIGGVEVQADREGATITLDVDQPGVDQPGIEVVQNAGSFVTANGTGHNRGFLEVSSPARAPVHDVPGWCGAAVMLAPSYLRDVGVFAPEFFLYYEDTDLSWRGRARGWRYRYVDAATVEHRHSATTGQGSRQTDVLQQRNRLLLLLRNAPSSTMVGSVATSAAVAARMGARAWLNRRRGGDDDATLARRRARGILAIGSQVRWARHSRRSVRVRRRIPDRTVAIRLRGDG